MNLLDRYIIKQFLSTVVFSLIALYFIFLVVSLMDNLDDFLDAGVKSIIIVQYYLYYFPEILKLLTPISMLLATIFSIGRLSNLNEITAMKTGGLSLLRLITPLIILSSFISGIHLYFSGWVVPKTTQSKIEIEQKYLKKSNDKSGPISNLYIRNSQNTNLSIDNYDTKSRKGRVLALDSFSLNQNPKLFTRIKAKEFAWDSIKRIWNLSDVTINYYDTNDRKAVFKRYLANMNINLNFDYKQLASIRKSISEMTYSELDLYLKLQKEGGKDIRKELTSYYGEWAYPFASVIIVLFVVPLASQKKRGGIAVQIATALVITFVYLIFTKVGQSIGTATNLNPLLSAWLANIIFFILGFVNLFRSKF